MAQFTILCVHAIRAYYYQTVTKLDVFRRTLVNLFLSAFPPFGILLTVKLTANSQSTPGSG